MVPVPASLSNFLELADWMELSALATQDHNSSQGDLERLLRLSAIYEPDGDEEIERASLDAFRELERRAKAGASGYPFKLDDSVLQAPDNWQDFLPYIFCLCLSYLRPRPPIQNNTLPARLFEWLACAAARNFLGGDAIRFASPRKGLPSAFRKAVDKLCMLIGEGGGFREQPTLGSQDRTLDVVAWRHFPDGTAGKLLLFAQCASGQNWTQKLTELQPKAFCDQWMLESPISQIEKVFFIPHRVEQARWDWYSRQAGLIFDRCRIAAWTCNVEGISNVIPDKELNDCRDWTDSVLNEIKS